MTAADTMADALHRQLRKDAYTAALRDSITLTDQLRDRVTATLPGISDLAQRPTLIGDLTETVLRIIGRYADGWIHITEHHGALEFHLAQRHPSDDSGTGAHWTILDRERPGTLTALLEHLHDLERAGTPYTPEHTPTAPPHGYTAEQAADPNTPGRILTHIVEVAPELRAHVAANPSAYPALLGWLSNLRDPAIDRALRARTT